VFDSGVGGLTVLARCVSRRPRHGPRLLDVRALAEEGWICGPVAEVVARRYLEPIFAGDDAPDTLL
jgi:glutamate racemase